jgi:Zn-dependent peptidase ImmA (M78 family)
VNRGPGGYRETSRWDAIEQQARFLQLELWNRRHELWGESAPSEPLKVLQPGVAFELKGYKLRSASSLEQTTLTGERVQIAGLLDRKHFSVQISSRFSKEEQFFTAAHELGHIVLGHHGEAIHRDRAFGEAVRLPRSIQEREADWFAAAFLMPAKQVGPLFEHSFLTDCFVLNDDTAFALCTKPLDVVLRHLRSVRDLSLTLASAITYGGRPIVPLHRIFGVSRTAMAIRLEQLLLVPATAGLRPA